MVVIAYEDFQHIRILVWLSDYLGFKFRTIKKMPNIMFSLLYANIA